MREARGERGTVVKGKLWPALAESQRLLERVVLFPRCLSLWGDITITISNEKNIVSAGGQEGILQRMGEGS